MPRPTTPNEPAAQLGRERRESVLRMISSFVEAERVAPTREEIAARLGVSSSAVQKHVRLLIAEGALEDLGGTRGLRVTA